MKRIILLLLPFCFCLTEVSAQLSSGEYFWDTDPGVGSGTAIPGSVFTGSVDDVYEFSPSTAGLSKGTHRLYYRFKEGTDWSQTISELVYIGEAGISGIGEEEVGILEYFWDEDSLGAKQIVLSTPAVNDEYNLSIPSTGLSQGGHKLHIRVKDKDGLWSTYVTSSILIFGSSPIATVQTIEYYLDTIPDPGNGESVSFSPSGSDVSSYFEVLTDTLADGQHVLTFRVQDSDNNWSAPYSKAFVVDPQYSLVAEDLPVIYYCSGGTIKVPITKTGDWPEANEFTLEISDETGENFVEIPTDTLFSMTGDTLMGTLPTGYTGLSGYRIRALSSLPYIRDTSSTVLTLGISVNAGSDSPACVGESANFTASANTPSTYSWSGPSFSSSLQNPTIASASLANNGTFTVTATNPGGCIATTTTTLIINDLPTPTTGSNSPVCVGQPINLTSSGGTGYSWSGPNGFSSASQNPSLTASLAAGGVYSVTVTNTNGCTAIATTSVTVNPSPVLVTHDILGTPANLTAGSVTSGSSLPSGTTLAYFNNAAASSPVSSPTAVGVGIYYIKATAPGSCTDIRRVVVSANCESLVVLTSPTNDISTGSMIRVSSNSVTGSNKNIASSEVVLDAADYVLLQPGFQASGAYFEAKIGGCANNN